MSGGSRLNRRFILSEPSFLYFKKNYVFSEYYWKN